MIKRYDQLIEIVEKQLPGIIIEIGVHRAVRASMFCEIVLSAGKHCTYTGYDVFETESERFQQQALNGKGMATQGAARVRLEMTQRKYPGMFNFGFVVGDTRKTLHGKTVRAEFAFIDGDHRVDAVEGDYEACKLVSTVVFDDYYLPDADGKIVDIEKYGANATVNRLVTEGKNVEILPAGDRVKHGGFSHLVVVRR